jgi:hypothetical protein
MADSIRSPGASRAKDALRMVSWAPPARTHGRRLWPAFSDVNADAVGGCGVEDGVTTGVRLTPPQEHGSDDDGRDGARGPAMLLDGDHA